MKTAFQRANEFNETLDVGLGGIAFDELVSTIASALASREADLRAAHRQGVAEERETLARWLVDEIVDAERCNAFVAAAVMYSVLRFLRGSYNLASEEIGDAFAKRQPDPADDAQPQVSTEPLAEPTTGDPGIRFKGGERGDGDGG